MTMPGALRRFTLSLAVDGTGIRSDVRHSGPSNALQVTAGRKFQDALRLAGLVFPICPNAHMAAGLCAIENAAGIRLSVAQTAAREAMILAEAIIGSVWRRSLTWPRLLNMPEAPAPIRHARAATAHLTSAIFPGNWTEAGGAFIQYDFSAAHDALEALRACLQDLQETAETVARTANEVSAGIVFEKLQPLGDKVFSAETEPGDLPLEETPLNLNYPAKTSATLGDWFYAHAAHAETMIFRLEQSLSQIRNETPVPCAGEISGKGIGIVTTSRGRLRHKIDIEQDRIVSWKAAPPTDWNFAPTGPIARYSQVLHPDRLEEQTHWLVAALDPCAPCDVAVRQEWANA